MHHTPTPQRALFKSVYDTTTLNPPPVACIWELFSCFFTLLTLPKGMKLVCSVLSDDYCLNTWKEKGSCSRIPIKLSSNVAASVPLVFTLTVMLNAKQQQE